MTAERCVFCARADQEKIGEFVSKNGCTAHVNCLVRALNKFMACSEVLFMRCHSILLPG